MPTHRHTSTDRRGANHTAAPVCVRAAGQQVRQLLEQGLVARVRANAMGWTRGPVSLTHFAMATVRTWLERNPYPSANALLELRGELWASVRCAMPANAAGKRRLSTIDSLIQTTQP